MSITIKHKRSAVASAKPTGAQIDSGEIAVNYSDTDPALYIKDSTGAVIRIAGNGAVGGTTSAAVAPTTPADGDTWVDTSVHPPSMKVWDATTSKWEVIGSSGSGTAPASPATGAVWVDTSTVPNVIKVWDGGSWVLQAGATITASVAPAAPATGQMWVDTSASPSPIKIWDGSSWVTTAATGAANQALANDAKYAAKAEVPWDRTGTEIHPKTAGDDVFTSGDVKVGGTTGTPSITLNANGNVDADGVIASGDFGSAAGKEGGYIWNGNGNGSQVSLYSNNTTKGAINVVSAPDNLTAKTAKFTVFNSGELRIGNDVSNAGPVGNVNISLNADGSAGFAESVLVGATGTALQKLHVSTGSAGSVGPIGIALGGSAASARSASIIKDTNAPYPLRINTSANASAAAGDLILGDASTERARLTSAGDFILGGTLPASPNISLNANGSGVFAGQVVTDRLFVDGSKSTVGNWYSLIKNTSGDIAGGWSNYDNSFVVGGDFTNANPANWKPNITLNADGSGSMAKGLSVATALGNNKRFAVSGTTGNVYVGQTAAFLDAGVVLSPDGHGLFKNDVEIGGTLPASPNITLKADGTAVFQDTITTGPNPSGGNSVCLQNRGAFGALSNQYSSGAFILGYGVKGAATGTGDFISTTGALNVVRVAYTQSGNPGTVTANGHSFWSTTGASKIATDAAVDLKRTFHISGTSGDVYIGSDIALATDAKISLTAATGAATFKGAVTATIVPPSDQKFKENITPANPQLADVVALGKQLKNFNWNDDAPLNEELRNVRQLGLIAQEAEKVSPGIVKTIKRTKRGKMLTKGKTIPAVYKDVVDPQDEEKFTQELVTPEQIIPATYEELDDSFKGISHDALIMKLLGAVAELSAEVEALKAPKTAKIRS